MNLATRYRLFAPSACIILALASVIKDADRITTWAALGVAAICLVVMNVFYLQLYDRQANQTASQP